MFYLSSAPKMKNKYILLSCCGGNSLLYDKWGVGSKLIRITELTDQSQYLLLIGQTSPRFLISFGALPKIFIYDYESGLLVLGKAF